MARLQETFKEMALTHLVPDIDNFQDLEGHPVDPDSDDERLPECIQVVTPDPSHIIDHDISHLPNDPRRHVLKIGYLIRDALDLIKDPLDVLTMDVSELTAAVKDLHEDRDIWFKSAEKSEVTRQCNRIVNYRLLDTVFYHAPESRLSMLLINPTYGLINAVHNAAIRRGRTVEICYTGRDVRHARATHANGLAGLGRIRVGFDVILSSFQSSVLAKENKQDLDLLNQFLKDSGIIVYHVADTTAIQQGIVKDAAILSTIDEGPYRCHRVAMHNRLYEDWEYNKSAVESFLGRFFADVKVYDHYGQSVLCNKSIDKSYSVMNQALPDVWKLYDVFIASKKNPLVQDVKPITIRKDVDLSAAFLNKPLCLTEKDLSVVLALRCVVKEKTDGYPAVAVCSEGNVYIHRVFPNGEIRPQGPIEDDLGEGFEGANFPGILQVEVEHTIIGTVYTYIDYHVPNHNGGFEFRRRSFETHCSEALVRRFIYNYRSPTAENMMKLLDPRIEGAVIQLLDVPLKPFSPCSFFMKKEPTIDVTFQQCVNLQFQTEDFSGVREFTLHGRFIRERPDKLAGNSQQEILRNMRQADMVSALWCFVEDTKSEVIWDPGEGEPIKLKRGRDADQDEKVLVRLAALLQKIDKSPSPIPVDQPEYSRKRRLVDGMDD